MEIARTIIIEMQGRERSVDLRVPLTLKEIYDTFFNLLKRRCCVSMSRGVARVNCPAPERENYGRRIADQR